MKILFLTTQFPYPLDNGGKIGALNGISTLELQNELTVLSFSENEEDTEGLEYYHKILPNVKFIQPIYHKIHIRKNLILLCKVMAKDYILKTPYILEKFRNKEMFQLIDQTMEKNSYDIVFIDYFNMTLYGNFIKTKYKNKFRYYIFKDHNLEFDIFLQESEKRKAIAKLIMQHEARLTKHLEIDSVKDSDMIFTVCNSDAKYLSQYNKNVYTMLPTFQILPFREKLSTNKKLLYIGNLSWKPNLDGMNWFLEKAWGKILEKHPDVSLDIIGSAAENNPFGKVANVNFLGYVQDISDIYANYKIFIVPLFEGSGIRIKILEAFNNDIAVVATSMSCETTGASAKELCIADTQEVFIDSIDRLLLDDVYNNELRKNAKVFLNKYFSLSSRQIEIKKRIDNLDDTSRSKMK